MKTTALMYHDIVPGGHYEISGFQDADAQRYKLDSEEFRRHLREIARQALSPVDVHACAGRTPPPGRMLLLTFDDGGSAALDAARILGEWGWPAHFFVTTDRIGEAGFLNPAQIRDLARMGHVVGSHSCSHPRLSRCPKEALDREWRDSVRPLADILGVGIDTAAVPGGYYNREVAVSAAAAGIRFLFTSEPVTSVGEVDGCKIVGRFCVRRGSTPEWVGAVVAGRVWPRLKSYLSWNGKKFLKRAGGEKLAAARRELWLRARG
jgi:peptidoglycan/xylan/chitin deacetylase (PgdA/CDA1 family)